MKQQLKHFFFGTVPVWKFWDTQSGFAGGVIVGLLILVVAKLIG
jgi:hypothetical protein